MPPVEGIRRSIAYVEGAPSWESISRSMRPAVPANGGLGVKGNVAVPGNVIVLDAMGVMYRARDDVAELLVPFVQRHRPSVPASEVTARYTEASLGWIDADAFWRSLGLPPGVEDDYLSAHRLTDGVLDFLALARDSDIDVWCLSNDVSRWSIKLRERFGLDGFFSGFVISGDIGHRKPSTAAYRFLLDRLGTTPQLFVDDRPRNVAAARNLDIPSVCFGPGCGETDCVADFAELARSRRSMWRRRA